MDTSLLRKQRSNSGHYASQLFPVLIALTAGSGMLNAANLLQTYAANGTTIITSVSLNCNTATGPGPSATIIVKPLTPLVSPNQIIVSATALSGSGTVNGLTGAGAANVVITAPGSQTLTATTTSLSYTISLAATPSVGCQGLTTAAPTFFFNHIVGTTTAPGSTVVGDVGSTVNTAVTATTSGLVAPATVNVTCVKSGSTYYPGPAQTVSVSSSAAGGNVFGLNSTGGAAAAGWLTLAPVSPSGTATAGTPVTFTVQAAAGCNALPSTAGSNTSTTTVNLSSTGTSAPDKAIAVTLTVSGPSASNLVVTPTAITVTCAKSGSTYTPNYPQTASVTASSSTAFTIDTSASAAWLNVSALTTSTATNSIPALLSIVSGTNCGGGAVGTSNVTTFHLAVPGALDRIVSVTGLIVGPTILQANPAAPSLTYVKGSGTAGNVDVAFSSTSSTLVNPFFTVNTATLPSWLRLDTTNGTAPKSIRFSSTSVADTIAPGTYNASVVVSVSGYGDLVLPVTMLLTNKAPQLTVQSPPSTYACSPASATTYCIPWVIGQALPTPTITAISTDTPIAYSATTGGLLAPSIPAAQQSGLAYSFGTPINVSFSAQTFAAAQPGTTLTGTLTLTWGSPVSTVVITFQVAVQSPGATILSYSPSTLPVESAGGTPYTVTLSGSGFVVSSDPTQATKVGVASTLNAPMVLDTNIHVVIVNQSNITLTITIPSGADAIPFAGGTFNIGVCNPVGGTCSYPTSMAPIVIGNNPIIQAVTSSSALLQNSTVSIAPYDMISIFGTNFCPNCTSTQVLTGSPDPVSLTYPTKLQFNSTTNYLSVTFQAHSGSITGLPVDAPVLFATNSQINLMVPSVVPTGSGNIDIVVNYGPVGSPRISAPYNVSIVDSDPGIFTIGADGQGSGAALDLNYNLIGAPNPAGLRTGAGNSDSISLYVTGLGTPDGTAANAGGGTNAWSTDCVSLGNYLTAFNNAQTGTALTSLDGTLIVPNVIDSTRLVPCLVSADITHLYVGGVDVASGLEYAGWVPGTIAGLYQINIKLPDNISGAFTTMAGLTSQSVVQPVQLPVQIVTVSGHSQAGVSLWVAPRLIMVGPTSGTGSAANTVGGTVGVALIAGSTNQVQASGGTGTITYAVTSGLLPSGLSLNAATGQISGVPAANTNGSYTVTVTATDSAPIPVTGASTFVVTIAQGLFMSNTTPTQSTFATANAGVSTVTASGGVSSYQYTMAITGHTLPTGLTINASTGVISTTVATPAASYLVKVSATDSTTGTPLTGSITFTVVVHDLLAATTPTLFSVGGSTAPGAYNTMVTTGGSGTYTYALDVASQAFVNANSSWLSFSSSTGVLTIGAGYVQTSSFTVTVTATDSATPANGSAAGTGSTTFPFVIGA